MTDQIKIDYLTLDFYHSVAYVEPDSLRPDVWSGQNKHTDEDVSVRCNKKGCWYEVEDDE